MYKPLKALFLAAASAVLLLGIGCSLSSDDAPILTPTTPLTHAHTYASAWTSNSTNHWHAATCEHTTEISGKAAHTYGGWTTVTKATETKEGLKKRTCSVCKYEQTAPIAALNHTHTFATEWTHDENKHWHKATCEHTAEKKDETTHTFDTWVTVKEATQTEEGSKKRTCSTCNYEQTAPIAALNHTHTFASIWTYDESNHWHAVTCSHTMETDGKAEHAFGDWVTVTSPTETEEGSKKRTCSTCKYEQTAPIATSDHTHTFAETWTYDETNHWHAATCEHTIEVKDKAAHSFGDWITETAATETSEGSKKHICSVCSLVVRDTIPKLTPQGTNPEPAAAPAYSGSFAGYSSVQFAAAMQSGWNLGNTFDANEVGNKINKGLSTETSWGMPQTTKAMIDTVADKGFKTIRIPISWHNHITEGANYTIDSEWLARIKTVVDWALAKDMFVIINLHHDNLTSGQMATTYGFSVNLDSQQQATSTKYITRIWQQVATYFKNYDHRLIFELLNEPRDMDTTNNGFSSSDSEVSARNPIIKAYEQSALNAVRATGGKNTDRFIMVPYYAASPWKDSGWSLPTDTASNKLLVSTHAYDPYDFAMGTMTKTEFTDQVATELENLFTNCINAKWVSNRIGVVMGEGSCTDKNNLDDRMKWFEDYVSKAKAVSCPLILWDNMTTISTGGTDVAERHGYFNRNNLSWFFPTLVEKMITTAGGSTTPDNTNGNANGGSNPGGTELISESYDMNQENWSVQCDISSAKFAGASATSSITVTYEKCTGTPGYASLKLTTHWEGSVENSAEGTLTDNLSFGSTDKAISLGIPNSTASFTFTPTAASWNVIKTKGLKIYGYGIKLTSVKLK